VGLCLLAGYGLSQMSGWGNALPISLFVGLLGAPLIPALKKKDPEIDSEQSLPAENRDESAPPQDSQ
jgi:hypothetical protein